MLPSSSGGKSCGRSSISPRGPPIFKSSGHGRAASSASSSAVAEKKRRLSDDSESSSTSIPTSTSSASSSSTAESSSSGSAYGRPTKRRPMGLVKLSSNSTTSISGASTAVIPAKSPHSVSADGASVTAAPKPALVPPSNVGSNIDQNVRVVVRVRPLSSKERREHSRESVKALPGCGTILVGSDLDKKAGGSGGGDGKRHDYDAVLGPESTQEEAYANVVAGDAIKSNIFRGFNVTILAYGQTGSGKTFSMGTAGGDRIGGATCGGEAGRDTMNLLPPPPPPRKEIEPSRRVSCFFEDDENEEEEELLPPSSADGIIPRAVYDLFHQRSTMKNGRSRVKIEMSYLEIYNEEARDLLSNEDKMLHIRDSRTEGVVVIGLSTRPVKSPRDVTRLMESASKRRAVGSTAMNAVSSRSHAICTLHVSIAPLNSDMLENEDGEGDNSSADEIRSKLTLVDLAGSERIKRTGAEGARMKEGININKGLFVLGQVVSALSELGQNPASASGASNHSHIPYRDSKLTRLLQDSLGGNSKTVMLACVSPADSNVEESVNTLRYATRARNIKNAAVRNVVASGISAAEAASLRMENATLKLELARLRMSLNEVEKNRGMLPSGIVGTSNISSGGEDSDKSSSSEDRSIGGVSVDRLGIVAQLRAKNASLSSQIERLEEQVQSSAEDALTASLKADRWQLKCEQIAASAKEKGVILFSDVTEGGTEDLVSMLRKEVAELKADLNETRADAAVARATAAAVIAGDGNLSAVEEMALLFEDDDSGKSSTGQESDENDEGDEAAVKMRADELSKELVAMCGTIEQKEAMAARMHREKECMEALQSHFEGALKRLHEEVSTLTSERESLLLQVAKSGVGNAKGGRRKRGQSNVDMDGPAQKKLRERISELEGRIRELQRKAAEHARSIRMKEQAEEKCARLLAEIAEDKRRKASLQRKLKESSEERRNEKKAAQQQAAKMIRDRQKLQRELNKVKQAAEKQAQVLKRKAADALMKQKREAEMQRKRANAASMRAATSGVDAVKEERKIELGVWVEKELEASLAILGIREKMDEQSELLREALSRKERLQCYKDKNVNDELLVSDMQSLDDEILSRKTFISQLEANITDVYKSSGGTDFASVTSDPNSAFADVATWQGLSRPEVRYLASIVFDRLIAATSEVGKAQVKHAAAIKSAVKKAVLDEKRKAEASLAELKLQHSETVMTLLESTKGAMEHKVRVELLTSENGAGLDSSTKWAIDDMLESFLSGCNKVESTVKDQLQKCQSQQEDMKSIVDRVAKDLVLKDMLSKNELNLRPNKKEGYVSDGEHSVVFEEEDDENDSDWSPNADDIQLSPRMVARKTLKDEGKIAKNNVNGTKKAKGDGEKKLKLSTDFSEETLQGENIPLSLSEQPEIVPRYLEKLTVAELRALLRERGMTVSGKKAQLLRRLRSDPTIAKKSLNRAVDADSDVKSLVEGEVIEKENVEMLDEEDKENVQMVAEESQQQSANTKKRTSRQPLRPKLSPVDTRANNHNSESPRSTKSTKAVAFLSSSPRMTNASLSPSIKRRAGPITQSAKKRRRRSMVKAVSTALESVESVLGNMSD